jgi:hypothetical protein
METATVSDRRKHQDNKSNPWNMRIQCVDGTSWTVLEPLSNGKYHQSQAPFEATRVHRCICVEDPHGKFADAKEAVVKIKYQ